MSDGYELESSKAGRAGDKEVALRSLALRLLSSHSEYHFSEAVDILVGEIPADMPEDLPFLEDSRIAGSLVRNEKNYPRYSILFDSALPPQDILDFYDRRMQAAGWSIPEFRVVRSGGFMFASGLDGEKTHKYCKSKEGPSLLLTVYEASAATEVCLILDSNPERSPCRLPDEDLRTFPRERERLIPDLSPPRGNRQGPVSGSGGNDHWTSSSNLTTQLDLMSVVTHYSSQLQRAGWSNSGEGSVGPTGCSTWTFSDAKGR